MPRPSTTEGGLYTANLRTATADRYVHLPGRRPRGLRAAIHVARLPVRGGQRALGRPRPEPARRHARSARWGRRSASFECSDELVNAIHRNVVWGLRGGLVGHPDRLPAARRAPRLGGRRRGDGAERAVPRRHGGAVREVARSTCPTPSCPSGAYPDVAPRIGVTGSGNAGWADAGVLVPWIVYQQTGNLGVIERQYDSMRRYLRFLEADHVGGIRHGGRYGDWLALEAPDQPRADRHGLPGARRGDSSCGWPACSVATATPTRSAGWPSGRTGCLPAAVHAGRRDARARDPDGLRPRARVRSAAHERPGGGRRSPRRPDRGGRWPPADRVPRHAARPPRAVRPRTPRAGDPSGPPGHLPGLGLRGPPGRDDDLGALGFVDAGARVRGSVDELVQPRGAGLASPTGCTRTSRASPRERPATGRCSFALGRRPGSIERRRRTSRPTAATRSSGWPMAGGSRSRSTSRPTPSPTWSCRATSGRCWVDGAGAPGLNARRRLTLSWGRHVIEVER